MSHPLTNEYWGHRTRGCPNDNLRCDDCGGYLSFEHHDAWHKIAMWNKHIKAAARAEREKQARKEESGKIQGWAPAPPPTIL